MALPIDLGEELIQTAIKAKSYAYSRYSKFRVGAALLCKDGTMTMGCNVENATYGATLCAERIAIVKAVSEGKKDFVAIAITSDVPTVISPCGICRQTLVEFCDVDMPVLLVPAVYPQKPQKCVEGQEKEDIQAVTWREQGGVVVETVGSLLPLSFAPEALERPRQRL